jgi:hypothetical protein
MKALQHVEVVDEDGFEHFVGGVTAEIRGYAKKRGMN